MKKKNLIAVLVLAALLTAGLGAALAAPGTAGDPFVTRSYLTDVYAAQAEQAMLQQAQSATSDTEQAALDRLSTLADGYLAQAEGREYADSFRRMTLSREDCLELAAGASLLFEAGKGTLSAAPGALVDVTAGSVLAADGALTPGHRYVAVESAAFTVTTDAAILSVMGFYHLQSTGVTQTPFTDLNSADWYYEGARFAYDNSLFQGSTLTTFSPATPMKRSMLATVLHRMAGTPGPVADVGFTDIPAGTWYTDGVNWAVSVGIVTGNGDGTFHPNTNLDRESMFVMLYRYAKNYLKLDTPASGDLSAFTDRASISPWAEEALSWAVGAGLLNGYPDGGLHPHDTTKRLEVAVMLQRFAEYLG